MPRASRLATDLSANRMRESSPPEAMRARGLRSSPGLGESRNSAVSSPRSVHVEVSAEPLGAGTASGENATWNRVRSMASRASSAWTFFSRSRAAARRFLASWVALVR